MNDHIIFENDSANLIDHKNYYFFIIKTKMGSLNYDLFKLLDKSIDHANTCNLPLVISSNSKNFSVGADLQLITNFIQQENFQELDNFLTTGQQVFMKLQHAQVPVFARAHGYALGGGLELLLHSGNIIAMPDLKAGFAEVKLGLLPSFGGVKEMFKRSLSHNDLIENLENIIFSYCSTNAMHCTKLFKFDNFIIEQNDISTKTLEELFIISNNKKINNELIAIPQLNLKIKLDWYFLNSVQKQLVNFFQMIIDYQQITEKEILELERIEFISLAKNPEVIENLQKIVH